MNNEHKTAFCKLLKEHLERLQDPAESLQSGGSINEMFRTFIRMKTTGLGTASLLLAEWVVGKKTKDTERKLGERLAALRSSRTGALWIE
ncbi:hypothetical protein SAMN05428981_102321 [Bacillus sp. OV194]|nr:hypothetical protein SAMN05428981_102321 [Bacillus sp. OV194]